MRPVSASADSPTVAAPTAAPPRVVLTGNPNCGKTTLFNALTGLRAKVGNYAGVTVERKEGRLIGTRGSESIFVLDLPGTYSLSPQSIDEQIARDVLFGRLPEVPMPELVVVVVDASNLERNLYYATQVIELGYPTLVALNMIDVAQGNGHEVDATALTLELGVPVFALCANTGLGVNALRTHIASVARTASRPPPAQFLDLPPIYQTVLAQVEAALDAEGKPPRPVPSPKAEALLLLTDERTFNDASGPERPAVWAAVAQARQTLEAAGEEWRSRAIEARYLRIAAIQERVHRTISSEQSTLSDRLDRVLTDKVWGVLVFVGLMALMFQCIFSFAQYPMTWLEEGVAWVGGLVGRVLPPGDLRSLIVDGVIAGVGAVVVFLPQILMLFLFIGLLEDTGYMARAAFLMDRVMSKVGLHGKSFIPMLSSFACAIPGIMATRTIETPKDRLATILVAPLMSCSARLPVYTLLIAACIPDVPILGGLRLPGLTLLIMYLLGLVTALVLAWVFKRTLLKGAPPLLIMELPPYRLPVARVVLRHIWERSRLFLRRAGTVILGISILLWFLATYPRPADLASTFAARRAAAEQPAATTEDDRTAQAAALAALDQEEAGERLRRSFAGQLGRAIEPLIRPLGFDWKIGIGIVTSFAAREVFVSTMSTVYNVGDSGDESETQRTLAESLRMQRRPDGTTLYTPLIGFTLMIFYVFALQCVSTVAVVRRETNGWKWPLFQWAYMGALAWGLAFLTYQVGRWLGFE